MEVACKELQWVGQWEGMEISNNHPFNNNLTRCINNQAQIDTEHRMLEACINHNLQRNNHIIGSQMHPISAHIK